MTVDMEKMIPLMGVEHDCILSKMGDVTAVYRVGLPEVFTLSNDEYEAFHQTWIKSTQVTA